MSANEEFLSDLMQNMDLSYFSPSLLRYLNSFLEIERVRPYRDGYVINTFIPPYPSKAFERFMSTFFSGEEASGVQSVDLAVTNACMFNCDHCYNAGRKVADLPTRTLKRMVRELQENGAIVLNFTGGEPCLRSDLPEICGALRDDSCGIVATTGYRFDDRVAGELGEAGVYSISVSLDSADRAVHDRIRGFDGAFEIAINGIRTALKNGLYSYTCAVPDRELLREENFDRLYELNRDLGVHEIQIIEPAPAGNLAPGDIDLSEDDLLRVREIMREYNGSNDGPAVSSFAHMEAPEYFGCGAAWSHIYVDGTGEVSPCNMIPITYGSAVSEDIGSILSRMREDFPQPYGFCIAHALADYFNENVGENVPVPPSRLPPVPLPEEADLPGFYRVLEEAQTEVAGHREITLGYNEASRTYEDYWLTVAAAPIEELFEKLVLAPGSRAVDCGCGTGYTTAKLCRLVGPEGHVTGMDLSPGMIEKAKQRLAEEGQSNAQFLVGDVLELLEGVEDRSVDAVLMTWLIGYVGCWEIFPVLARKLRKGGVVGLVAHLDRSPLVPIEVFEELTREDPTILQKAVKLKFPLDGKETASELEEAGFEVEWIRQASFDFCCDTGQEVLDHVMKSGAGTTFYYSLRPDVREQMADRFIAKIESRYRDADRIRIGHDYVDVIARLA